MNKTLLALIGVLALGLAQAAFAADAYPTKPIRVIVPFPAGGSADIRTRQLAPLVAERLKQPLIVVNQPGANGNIGAAAAANSSPDGHTVVYVTSGMLAINPHIYPRMGFDPRKDLQPVILATQAPAILVVKADSPIDSVGTLIRQAKTAPGKLTFATVGAGSYPHLMGERLKRLAGIDLSHVPYKGETQALVDLISGQIDLVFGFPLATMPHIQSGKVRPLAVTSAKRLGPLPEVPSLAEADMPGYDEAASAGYAVPAGTPPAVVDKLFEAFHAALHTPDTLRDVIDSGVEVLDLDPRQATQRLLADYERFGAIVKALNLRLD